LALTPKQQAFVDAYTGNGTDAARAAGYTGTDGALAVSASKLLKLPKVREAIDARRAKENSGLIASRAERQEFWTKVMKAEESEMRDRLKASELLGRSEADFIENTRLSDANGDPIVFNIHTRGGK
jgi:phage terminase small subunit